MSTDRPRQGIDPLPHPNDHYIRRAEGWLDLGNPKEAHHELDQITAEERGHPEVLCLRWFIYRKSGNWEECMVVARDLTQRFAHNPCGWIALAQTLYHTKRVAEAYEIGMRKAPEFSGSWQCYFYDTACYACLLGKRSVAEQFLQSAMAVGDGNAIMLRAMEDPDLAPVCRPAK